MKGEIIKALSKSLGMPEEKVESILEIPKDTSLGDYALPCFTLAKELRKNPVEIAKDLASNIKSPNIEKVQAVGPYVNIFVNSKKLALETLNIILKEKNSYGSGKNKEKTVIEFPSPNTNKPLHIGHARNIILGQALANILRFSGDKVKTVNLSNDRGVHICKSMVAYAKFGKDDSPEKAKRKSDHFVGDYYVKFVQEAAKDPSLEEEAQKYLVKWEARDKKIRALWKKMNGWALKGFNQTYKKFSLKIDKEYLESDIYESGKDIVLEQQKNGIVNKKADGALFIDLSDKNLGEKILLRADGTSIYIIQDIYLAVLKQRDFKFTKSLYVCAREQEHHFKVLFETLQRFGYPWAKKLCHISYGMVNLESGRMKSREGNVVDSDDLIEELKSLAAEEIILRWPKLSKKELEKRATVIAMAAMRYYFLKVDKGRDVTFKPEESIKFEGDTGPYLLYSYARARSILSKAKYKPSKKISPNNIVGSEKRLISYLSKFPQVVASAYESLSPNLIANYAYELSQKFNEFYHEQQVIGSEEESFRLALVDSLSQTLKNSLSLLGISVLEKM